MPWFIFRCGRFQRHQWVRRIGGRRRLCCLLWSSSCCSSVPRRVFLDEDPHRYMPSCYPSVVRSVPTALRCSAVGFHESFVARRGRGGGAVVGLVY